MADFLIYREGGESVDLLPIKGDLATDSGLENAVLLSVFVDAQVDEDELPLGETDRRGWWADEFSDFKIGSKLWLLAREKPTDDLLGRAEEIVQDALAWMRRLLIASSIEVDATYKSPPGLDAKAMFLSIQISRPDKSVASYRYWLIWETYRKQHA